MVLAPLVESIHSEKNVSLSIHSRFFSLNRNKQLLAAASPFRNITLPTSFYPKQNNLRLPPMNTEDTDKRYDSSGLFTPCYESISFFYRCPSVVISFLLFVGNVMFRAQNKYCINKNSNCIFFFRILYNRVILCQNKNTTRTQ